MSRVCRSVKVDPSVTMYWRVSTFVLSIVGSYTSDRTPSATVYQTLEAVSRAVPRQSLRARSKYDSVPGPPGAVTAGCAAPVLAAPVLAAPVPAAPVLVGVVLVALAGPASATAKDSVHTAAAGPASLRSLRAPARANLGSLRLPARAVPPGRRLPAGANSRIGTSSRPVRAL